MRNYTRFPWRGDSSRREAAADEKGLCRPVVHASAMSALCGVYKMYIVGGGCAMRHRIALRSCGCGSIGKYIHIITYILIYKYVCTNICIHIYLSSEGRCLWGRRAEQSFTLAIFYCENVLQMSLRTECRFECV